MRKIVNKKVVLATLFVALFVLPVLSMGSYIEYKAQKTFALPEPEEGDIASFFDVLGENITFTIDPPSSQHASNLQLSSLYGVHKISKIRVKSATVPYSIAEMELYWDKSSIPTLHNAKPEFLRAYFTAAKLTGEYNLGKLFSMAFAYKQGTLKLSSTSELASALSVLTTANDTASASGFVDKFEEKYAVTDLRGDTDYSINVTDQNETVFDEPLEATYQEFAAELSGNTSETDLISATDVDNKENSVNIVSGFDNTEEDGFLETLRANIAANYSTSSDQIDPSRVHILDYNATAANKTDYLTENFFNRVRQAVEEYQNTEAQAALVIFGVTIKLGTLPLKKVAALSLRSVFGRVMRISKTFVSTPLRTASKLLKKPINSIKSSITSSVNLAKAHIRRALSRVKSSPIVKTVSGSARSFVGAVTQVLKDPVGTAKNIGKSIINSAGKITNKALTALSKIPKAFGFSFDKLIILAGIGLAGLMIFFILYSRLTMPRAPKYRPY